MNVAALNRQVTVAIARAESLEDTGNVVDAHAAYYDVSVLEEELATRLPARTVEGQVARDGAVRAALSAGLFARARALAEKYAADVHLPSTLVAALRQMRDEAERELGLDALTAVRIFPEAKIHFHDAA